MFDNKFLITLIGMIVAVVAINNFKDEGDIKEGFLGNLPSMHYSAHPVQKQTIQRILPNGKYQTKNYTNAIPHGAAFNVYARNKLINKSHPQTNDQEYYTHTQNGNRRIYNKQRDHRTNLESNENFVSYPSFQSNISPRFSSIDYGANIRYNLPSVENLGVPLDPLSMSKIVSDIQEDFPVTCGVGSVPKDRILNSREERRRRKNKNTEQYTTEEPKDNNSHMPVGDMTQQNSGQDIEHPIIYDRFIFANRDSRSRSQGDMIRGDLAIVPLNTGMFVTSQSRAPHRVLQLGAMNVMRSSEDMDKLATFVTSISGGVEDIVGGVRLSKKELDNADINANHLMTAQYSNNVGPSNNVHVTAFP